MKTSYVLQLVLAISLFSCGDNKETLQVSEFNSQNTIESYSENNESNQQERNNQNIKYYEVMSKQFGIPVGSVPIPTTWKKSNNTQENILFEGSNGVKVYNEQFSSFSYHNDPQRNQIMQQNGSAVQPLKSLENVINNDFKPFLLSKGIHFIKQYPLPQLAQFDKQFDSYLFKATPEQKQYQCMVTEWKDQNGNLSVGVIRYFITQYTSIGGLDWGYTINSMEAPEAVFEEAKFAFINALINFQVNPQWVQVNNQYYAQMAQQNNARHQQRMAAIKSQGQQILANGRARSQAMDAQYNNWRNNQAASDRSHENYIDGIYDRQVVTNQNTGQEYKVDGYNSQVWMNNNNEYISNNNSLYNPNLDNTVNNQEWTQLETNGY
ncbi:hypothetical protein [Xanthomarina sp. GH4-25]|jgi:hypothetical protein|uniref:hypothetical protein n=1 Tax=Xanthomarina sp. GH4-25 TaxID=3349335 RepID=UPI000D684A1B|nr:hypothetical protein DI383_00230 [Flavobacteriaceae bacterium LYZ1037]